MLLSTSNSNLRAPRLNYRYSIVATLIVSALLSAGLVMVNAYLDPFHLGDWGPKANIDRIKAFRRQSTPLWHVAGIKRVMSEIPESKNAEVLIVGDSRARAMTGSWQFDSNIYAVDSKGRRIFNLAYGGAGISESIDLYNHYKDKFPYVKTVVFSADFEKIANIYPPGAGREKLNEALSIAKYPIVYYLNFRTLGYYLKTKLAGDIAFLDPLKKEKFQVTNLNTPKRFTEEKEYSDAGKLDEIFKRDSWLKTAIYMEGRINGANFQALETTLETNLMPMVNASPEVEFIFVTLPIHPYFEKVIAVEKRTIYIEMRERLSEMGSVYDALLYDEGKTLFEIQDSQHVSGAAISILQDALDCHETSGAYAPTIAYLDYSPCLINSSLYEENKPKKADNRESSKG